MKMKIGVISAHPDAEKVYGGFAEEFQCELIFAVGFWTQSREIGVRMQEKHQVNALITVGIPMEIFFDKEGQPKEPRITIPVYPILATNYDILNALSRARSMGKRPGFAEVQFSGGGCDMERIRELLGFPVEYHMLPHDSQEGVEKAVRAIIRNGIDVMVTTGGFTYHYGLAMGFPTLLVMPEPMSFRATLGHVRAAFVTGRAEAERSMWLSSVFDSSREGILVLDEKGRIVIVNRFARRMLSIPFGTKLEGRRVDSLPGAEAAARSLLAMKGTVDVLRFAGQEYILQKERLYHGADALGHLFRISLAKGFQKVELDARRKLNERGFVARCTFSDIQGSGQLFTELKHQAASYAQSKSNVVIYGESGCGKELFAQSIHNASLCADGPFVAVNCIVLTENLLESELFGYEEGAFTGAKKGGKQGLFEMAHKGTLFLDEIGDMPLNLQGKLLRVLQERVVRPVGGSRYIPVDVRCIFATNKNLKEEVQAGRFRSDLYYRINVLTLHIPPLRRHMEDIGEIAEALLGQLAAESGASVRLSAAAAGLLGNYRWPGNVRELRNFLERAFFLNACTEEGIERLMRELEEEGTETAENEALAGGISVKQTKPGGALALPDGQSDRGRTVTLALDTIHNMELALIRKLYVDYRGDLRRVGMTLGLSSSSVYRKIKEIELPEL